MANFKKWQVLRGTFSRISQAIGVASLLMIDGVVAEAKDGTVELVAEALVAILNRAFGALVVDD
jgi:acylphosphatase